MKDVINVGASKSARLVSRGESDWGHGSLRTRAEEKILKTEGFGPVLEGGGSGFN